MEAALRQVEPATESAVVWVKQAGRRERIEADSIAALSSAGDYVTIRLLGGREILQKATLASLRKQLPESFVSVHRSHVVNTRHVAALTRAASGVGELRLADGAVVPVSRRMMPSMRRALGREADAPA